jgi:hypothetical protein
VREYELSQIVREAAVGFRIEEHERGGHVALLGNHRGLVSVGSALEPNVLLHHGCVYAPSHHSVDLPLIGSDLNELVEEPSDAMAVLHATRVQRS